MVTGDAEVTAQDPNNENFGEQRSVKGKWALVTGADSGIGRSIAIALAKHGARVLVAGLSADAVEDTASLIRDASDESLSYILDVTDDEGVAMLGQFVDERCEGKLDVLVHAAERNALASIDDCSELQLDTVFSTNMRAPFLITRRLLPSLRRATGDVVFVNSSASFSPRADAGVYAASKAALRAFADALRAEVNADGVRVLSIFTGHTASPMQMASASHGRDGRIDRPEELIQSENVAAASIDAILMPRTAELTELLIRPSRRV